jgi:LPS sulfotransferase NodH
VIICFVNRSGSNFLAECLASSGQFPRAREFFLKPNLLREQTGNAELSDIFEAIVRKHTLNGNFATKLGFSQLAFFESRGFLEAAFARTQFILLKRGDVLAQAVSLEIASQTRRWRTDKMASGEPEPQYSRKRIELKIRGIRKKYEQFEHFFAARALTPFTVDLTALASHPAQTVAEVGEFLGGSIQFDPAMEHSKRNPDPLKEAWKLRYLSGD